MAIPATAALNAYARAASMGAEASPVAAPNGAMKPGAFGDMLETALKDAVGVGHASEKQIAGAVAKDTNIIDVVTAVSEAEATLQTVVAVRDKVISAYQEIMRMPI